MRSDPPEPKGKLDAMLTDTKVDAVTVNGPEDVLPAWDAIDWRTREEEVRRLRQRIFKAAQEQDWPRVRNLQKLMLRSRSNTLVSVRHVTQRNAGRMTAGIDGEVALTSKARGEVAVRVHRSVSSWKPVAVRRVYIPKASNPAKSRPLGIPVIMDRCHQARVRNALEPEWEARFEPRSYGFRPGRGCHDAIEAIYAVCKGPRSKRAWILDADLAAAFDKIDHSRLLQALGSFPARGMIEGWLKAGGFEAGKGFAPTGEGGVTTHRRRWRLRAVVVSVAEKAHEMRQVRAGKANVSEPLLKRRKRSGVIKTGVQSLPRDEPGGCLLTGQAVTGVKVARARFRHQHGTWEPVAPRVLAGCWAGQPKGVPQAAETARGRVPERGTGADRLVVAVRPGNAGGAKGTGCPGSLGGQPAWPGGAG